MNKLLFAVPKMNLLLVLLLAVATLAYSTEPTSGLEPCYMKTCHRWVPSCGNHLTEVGFKWMCLGHHQQAYRCEYCPPATQMQHAIDNRIKFAAKAKAALKIATTAKAQEKKITEKVKTQCTEWKRKAAKAKELNIEQMSAYNKYITLAKKHSAASQQLKAAIAASDLKAKLLAAKVANKQRKARKAKKIAAQKLADAAAAKVKARQLAKKAKAAKEAARLAKVAEDEAKAKLLADEKKKVKAAQLKLDKERVAKAVKIAAEKAKAVKQAIRAAAQAAAKRKATAKAAEKARIVAAKAAAKAKAVAKAAKKAKAAEAAFQKQLADHQKYKKCATERTQLKSLLKIEGNGKGTGLLSAKKGGEFKPVCDGEWNDVAANIACKQLGFAKGKKIPNDSFGKIAADYSLDDIRCKGTEKNLLKCKHIEHGKNCNENMGAAISCEGTPKPCTGLQTKPKRRYADFSSSAVGFGASVMNFTVPAGVNSLLLEAWGAQGSDHYGFGKGGKGAYSKVVVSVSPGATLSIVVGQRGRSPVFLNSWNGGSGGGGGSFVYSGGTLYIAAGGGGGASLRNDGHPKCDGKPGQNINSGSACRSGCAGGSQGANGSGKLYGKGWNSIQSNASGTGFGGYGGGGTSGSHGAGGGGGYSGGGGNPLMCISGGSGLGDGGGGGGSYTSPTGTAGVMAADKRAGDGRVLISGV